MMAQWKSQSPARMHPPPSTRKQERILCSVAIRWMKSGRELNISVVSLMMENEIESIREVIPGLVLTILEDAPAYGMVPALDEPEDETDGQGGGLAGERYVIQPGDTLDVIGQERNVSVISLQIANDITDNKALMPGQTIIIPDDAVPYGIYPALDMDEEGGGRGGSVDGELYVIQPRDTLDEIALEHDVSVISLQIANNITDNHALTPGQTIIIPADAPPYGTYPALDTPEDLDSADGETYVVQPRETIDGISADFNVSAPMRDGCQPDHQPASHQTGAGYSHSRWLSGLHRL